MQQRACARIFEISRSIREDQSACSELSLLWALSGTGSLSLPDPAGVGQPRRAYRSAPSRLRGERRTA
ncbi:hypothetical protein Pint_11374 [Pistacia integerrima]|uniref:Uncharacterized protein n=1 Tax=Pistacia integerrima TaxID=434235 RepID=A0ACC0XHC2_9ROSI|nr:hypothetical protein Pint_11374 [Pistacia integerrima]